MPRKALGERLRLARKKEGLSIKALTDRVSAEVSISRGAISSYEAGKTLPPTEVLMCLVRILDVPPGFLMGSRVEGLHETDFRKHSKVSVQKRALAEVVIIEKIEDYLSIEQILELPPAQDPFKELKSGQIKSFAEVDALAEQLRDKWALGKNPVPSMFGLLEDKGIKVIEADLPEGFHGMTSNVKRRDNEPDVPFIVVSSNTNVERKRFNLAHELGHRIIGATDESKINLEKAVDRFAGAFLIPSSHLREEMGSSRTRTTSHEILHLKHLYGVSAVAMLMRLKQTGFLSEDAVRAAFRSYARGWRTREPNPVCDDSGFGAFERPKRFEQLVWRALGEGIIHPVRAARLLRVHFSTVEQGIQGACES